MGRALGAVVEELKSTAMNLFQRLPRVFVRLSFAKKHFQP